MTFKLEGNVTMSLEELREQNKEKVVATALDCFVKNGIEHTKIAEIAKRADLTERSLYRYFETKADLVLAAALLFWDNTVDESIKACTSKDTNDLSAKEQIYFVLHAYANQYFTSTEKLAYIQEAEAYLRRSQMLSLIRNKPPAAFECGTTPLCLAVYKGLEDGSIKDYSRAERLYYNAYDSLLGLMQKMACSADDSPGRKVDEQLRLDDFCKMLAQAFCE